VGEWWYSSTILDLGTRRRWVVSFTLRPFYIRGNGPGTRWIRDWVDHRAVWTLWNRNKSFSLAGNQTPAVQSLTLLYTDWAIPPVPMTICSKHSSSRDSLLQISETILIFTYERHIWLINFNKNCNVPTKFSQYEITWSALQLLYSDRQTWRSS
jgi:hypothetical protein